MQFDAKYCANFVAIFDVSSQRELKGFELKELEAEAYLSPHIIYGVRDELIESANILNVTHM